MFGPWQAGMIYLWQLGGKMPSGLSIFSIEWNFVLLFAREKKSQQKIPQSQKHLWDSQLWITLGFLLIFEVTTETPRFFSLETIARCPGRTCFRDVEGKFSDFTHFAERATCWANRNEEFYTTSEFLHTSFGWPLVENQGMNPHHTIYSFSPSFPTKGRPVYHAVSLILFEKTSCFCRVAPCQRVKDLVFAKWGPCLSTCV